jgi:4'-phosphopantetheinyl transferase
LTAAGEATPSRGCGVDPQVWMIDLRAAQAALLSVEGQSPRLTGADHDRAARFASYDHAQEWLAAHVALRLVLERTAGAATRGVVFERSAAGRPSLPGGKIDFSLSHGAGHALIGVTSFGCVGVDVEGPRVIRLQNDRREAIEGAGATLDRLPLPNDPGGRFLQAWVRLEALAKAEGIGMAGILSRAGAFGQRRGQGVSPDLLPPGFAVKDLAVGDGLYGAIALTEARGGVQLGVMPTDETALRHFPLA